MAKAAYKVPFKNGSLQHYARDNSYYHDDVEWRDNTSFDATISFDTMSPSWHRSAKYLMVSNKETGVTYPMFVRDTLGVLQYGSVSDGICRGTWVVQKRGQNYGLRLVEPHERENASES